MLLRQVEDAAELDANALVFLVTMVVATAATATCMVMGVSVVMMVVMATATRMLVVVMMVMMYLAEGTFVVGSANPVVDSHLVYALVLVLVALLGAGDTLGLGRWWKGLGLVKKLPFLI